MTLAVMRANQQGITVMDIEQRYNVAVKALRTIAGFGHVEGCTSSAPVHECGCYDRD